MSDSNKPSTVAAKSIERLGVNSAVLKRQFGVSASEVEIANASEVAKTVQILSLESGFYDQSQKWVGGSAFRLASRADGTVLTDFADPQHNFIKAESWGLDYRIFTHGHSTNFIPIGVSVPAKDQNGASGEINNPPLDWLGALQAENYREGTTNTDAFFQKQLAGEIRVSEVAGDRYKAEDGDEYYFPEKGTEIFTFGNWDELNVSPYVDNPETFLDHHVGNRSVRSIEMTSDTQYMVTTEESWFVRVVIDPPGAGGTQATAKVSYKNPSARFSPILITIDDPGSGYKTPPRVKLLGGAYLANSGKPEARASLGDFDGGKWPTIFDKHKNETSKTSTGGFNFTKDDQNSEAVDRELKLAFRNKKSREWPGRRWETYPGTDDAYRGDPTSLNGFLPDELARDYFTSMMFSERNFGHSYVHAKGLNVNFKMRERDYNFGPQFTVDYSFAEPKEVAAPKWTETPSPAWDIDLDAARAELFSAPCVRADREEQVGNHTSYQFGDTYSYHWGYERNVWVARPDRFDGGDDDYAEAVGREAMATTQTFPGGLKQSVAYLTKNEEIKTEGGARTSNTFVGNSLSSVTYQGAEFGATIFGTKTSTNVAPLTMITKGPPVGKIPNVTNIYPTIKVDLRLGLSNFDIRLRTNVVKLKLQPLGLFFGFLKGCFNFVVTRVGAPGWATKNELKVEVDSTVMEARFNEMGGSISVLWDDLDAIVVGNGIKAGVSDINNDVNMKLKAELTKIENKIAEIDSALSNAEVHTAAIESAATHVNSSLTHISAHALAASV